MPTTGNVGVGTLTPATKLEVVGNTALKGAVTVRDSVTIQKRLTVNQNIKVTGKSVFVDKARFKNNVNVLGNGIFKNNLSISGLTKMKGNATVLGNFKIKSLTDTNTTQNRFLSIKPNGKVIGLDKSGLINAIYQPLPVCRTDQNGNIGARWRRILHPNYGILYTGTGTCPARVGIGINNPTTALDVDGQITMRVGAAAGFIPIADASGTMTWTDPSSIITGGLWQSNSPNIYFNTGNVGIGTNNPIYPLDVSGQIHANGNITSGGADFVLGIDDARPQGTIPNQRAMVHSPTNDVLILNYGGDFEGGVKVNGIKTIFDGNVGIGVTNPVNKLEVCGTIRSTEWIVETGWCDYKFEPDYKKMTWQSKQDYIAKYKHLPKIDAGKDIETKGLKVGKTMSGFVWNIEDNTMDIISLYKDNITQKKQLDLLVDENTTLKAKYKSLEKRLIALEKMNLK